MSSDFWNLSSYSYVWEGTVEYMVWYITAHAWTRESSLIFEFEK